MQIQNIKTYQLNNLYITTPSFKSATNLIPKKPAEFIKFYAGIYGTRCDNSKPLADFFCRFKKDAIDELKKRGLSTNIDGIANSFLKSKWDNPISTSGVYDCSVMYLANENTKTHFLYHLYKDADYDKTVKIIKQLMPEGFTYAAIVPGDSRNVTVHKKYLHEVYNAIKDLSKDGKVQIHHFNSKSPEIVGYEGYIYEIPRENYSYAGQSSFNIEDINYYDKFYLADIYQSTGSLEQLQQLISADMIDIEAKKVQQKYIQDKIDSLKPKNKILEYFIEIKDKINKVIENIILIKNALS